MHNASFFSSLYNPYEQGRSNGSDLSSDIAMATAENLPGIPANPAIFLDIDGTISDIAPTPEKAFIAPEVLALLSALRRRKVPLALISGRTIASMDAMTFPQQFPAAGQHGLELRDAYGWVAGPDEKSRVFFALLAENIKKTLAMHEHLYVENKGFSIAVHYRNAPAVEKKIKAILTDIAASHDRTLVLQYGKMIAELRLRGRNKGDAVACFMRLEPFTGRTPVYIGDDITDEAGFSTVNALAGLSIKVGEGPTQAHYRLGAPADVKRWLQTVKHFLPEQGNE